MLQPPSLGSFVLFFVDLFGEGGGSTVAAVILDTVADESRKKMADGVTRSPSRLCSREGKICCSGDALVRFSCVLAFVPCFLLCFSFFFPFFFSLHAGTYVYLGVSSSVQQSATLSKYVFYATCSFCSCHLYLVSFVPYPMSEFFCFFFSSTRSIFFS